MAAGKTHVKHIKILVDDSGATARDITAAVSNVSGVGLKYDETDVTGYSDGVVNFQLGHPSSEIEISGPIDNTAASGAHTVLSGIVGQVSATVTVEVQFGIRGAPTSGDPNFSGEYFCSSYVISGDATYTARFVPGSATAPAFGAVA